uniref:Fibrillin-1-like n=1 Tax=Phallusia mammillata TaxID=59560 RepID=A0A6F9DCJ7_9ASCI|nr:fibrillin-1-like [Phallusia mammillata]
MPQLEITAFTHTSVIVTFVIRDQRFPHTVFIRNMANGLTRMINNVVGDFVEVTGLDEATNYEFVAEPEITNMTVMSEPVFQTTVFGRVKGFGAEQIGSSFVVLGWLQSQGAQSYVLNVNVVVARRRRMVTGAVTTINLLSNATGHNVTGLQAAQSYTLELAAQNSAGTGLLTELRVTTRPNATTGLIITNPCTTPSLTWDSVDGATNYSVLVTSTFTSATYITPEPSLVLTNLSNCLNHTVAVSACNDLCGSPITGNIIPDCCDVKATCANCSSNFACTCQEGYHGDGKTCTDMDECGLSTTIVLRNETCVALNRTTIRFVDPALVRTCHSIASCGNINGSFNCDCPAGYMGDGTDCQDRNECEDFDASTANCNNTNGSFECVCREGFTGDDCNHCTDIDECENNSAGCHANATCNNTIGSFVCECISGFSGNGTYCSDIDECIIQPDICFSNINGFISCPEPGVPVALCHKQPTCENTIGNYSCVCGGGFIKNGSFCEDINECLSNPYPCHTNARCDNTAGNYSCVCRSGYTGNGTYCSDTAECMNSSNLCHMYANCSNTEGSYSCECKPGFEGDGFNCTSVDCLSTPCHINASCTSEGNRYQCTCKTGFTGNGTYCKDIDECTEGNHSCQQKCQNQIGSFNCVCNTGFTSKQRQSCKSIFVS